MDEDEEGGSTAHGSNSSATRLLAGVRCWPSRLHLLSAYAVLLGSARPVRGSNGLAPVTSCVCWLHGEVPQRDRVGWEEGGDGSTNERLVLDGRHGVDVLLVGRGGVRARDGRGVGREGLALRLVVGGQRRLAVEARAAVVVEVVAGERGEAEEREHVREDHAGEGALEALDAVLCADEEPGDKRRVRHAAVAVAVGLAQRRAVDDHDDEVHQRHKARRAKELCCVKTDVRARERRVRKRQGR